MKVSVCMICYNQAEYISTAIEGVLGQTSDYDIELIISDDCSTDNSKSVIESYREKYPTIVRVLTRDTNIGMMPNFIETLSSCKGDYVAICEGDDYWIDSLKIQKQVDFLEANKDYSICFSRVYELSNGVREISSINPWNEEKTFDIYDIAKGNFIHTPSVLFRNGLINPFPVWFAKSSVGDYVVHMLNARKGLIKYLPEPMAVYRRFVGTWSSISPIPQILKFVGVLNNLLLEDFDSDTKTILKSQRHRLLAEYYGLMLKDNNFEYLESLDEELANESDFIRNWMLSVYPNQIKAIHKSRIYQLSLFLSDLKKKLIG